MENLLEKRNLTRQEEKKTATRIKKKKKSVI